MEMLVPGSSSEDKPALAPISPIPIPSIQNNLPS